MLENVLFQNKKNIYTYKVHAIVGTLIDEIKNYIYAFIKYYDTLKNDLYKEHNTIFTEGMINTERLDM
ncbi:Plasmodium exported protein, unknown function, fragment [Plasmodium reichenowi]|uniref:Uncharacterized protein n=1 Tax=Plasmodium reichenowi TaxID=5854 RepID=A0A060RMR8_PLARE|nr:Plasmodium exported protein, unknown function, fragment [Plasmodium reichenowi]